MDRKPDKQTINLLKKQINFLKKVLSPRKIILIGSRARGEHLEGSDVDLIVVSEKFEKIPFRERIIQAYGPWDKKQGLEIICYTPQEFEEKKRQIGIIQNALKESMELT